MVSRQRTAATFGVISLTLLYALLGIANASEDEGIGWGSSGEVRSDGDRLHATLIERIANDLRSGDHPLRSSSGSGGEQECEIRVEVLPELEGLAILHPSVMPDQIPVRITCGSALIDERWISPTELRDVPGEAREGARRYVETVLAPQLALGTSPPDNILVGLDTWFWLDGWDGTPITTTVTAPWGDSIDLRLTLADVEWNFGDGSPPLHGGLGEPYPAESTVRHLYTHRSTSPANPEGAYELRATITIAVDYWYAGAGPTPVAPLEITHVAPVTVRQLQAVIG